MENAYSHLVKSDTNHDGSLDRNELNQAMQQPHTDSALTNFLLQNYDEVAGLGRSRFDTWSAPGVSHVDIARLHALELPNWQRSLAMEARLDELDHTDEIVSSGALYGTLIGCAASAAELTAIRFLPGKYRAPLMGAALISPLIGSSVGPLYNFYRNSEQTERFIDERLMKADSLAKSLDKTVIEAHAAFDTARDERLGQISILPAESKLDGYIDSFEYEVAQKVDAGTASYSKYLNSSYSDLELLSRNPHENIARGVSEQTFRLLEDPLARSFHFSQKSFFKQSENEAPLSTVIGLGGVLAMTCATRLLPPRYRMAGYVAAGAAGLAPIAVESYQNYSCATANNNLRQSQMDAMERIFRSVKH